MRVTPENFLAHELAMNQLWFYSYKCWEKDLFFTFSPVEVVKIESLIYKLNVWCHLVVGTGSVTYITNKEKQVYHLHDKQVAKISSSGSYRAFIDESFYYFNVSRALKKSCKKFDLDLAISASYLEAMNKVFGLALLMLSTHNEVKSDDQTLKKITSMKNNPSNHIPEFIKILELLIAEFEKVSVMEHIKRREKFFLERDFSGVFSEFRSKKGAPRGSFFRFSKFFFSLF